jgi:hypothetical protein
MIIEEVLVIVRFDELFTTTVCLHGIEWHRTSATSSNETSSPLAARGGGRYVRWWWREAQLIMVIAIHTVQTCHLFSYLFWLSGLHSVLESVFCSIMHLYCEKNICISFCITRCLMHLTTII